MDSEERAVALDDEVLSRLQCCLSRHPVSFAMVFGSAVRDEMNDESDLDLAIVFESHRPDDDGYSDTYLGLLSDLDESVPRDVDVVDFHSMSSAFAQVVFDTGRIVLGSETQRDELERELGGNRPSVTEARDRVSRAAERLRANDHPEGETRPE